jgi:hypothetical protein
MVYIHDKGFGKSVIETLIGLLFAFKNNYYCNKKLKWSLN